ncbi:MAG: VOC family protein [Burkholderiales bacterium]|nr:VOC family protein [Burkholderiales bacterium]
MKSPWISGLRSVALTVPDLSAAEAFYTKVWHLDVVDRASDAIYLGGSGSDHHLLALHQSSGAPKIRKVTLRARSLEALHKVEQATIAAGGTVERGPGPATDPAGGSSLCILDGHGRRFEVVFGDKRMPQKAGDIADQPIRLAHAVLNSHEVEKTQEFMEKALGFTLSDRTRIMAFMNCDSDHHTIALGDTDNDSLNHIAFLMPTLDAVMRGGGRMKDAGHDIQWGPGRHGPGDNAFNYFIDPFGIVIEYTAEVEQIDETYQPGKPSDWTWPPGRIDQWGIAISPTPRLKDAQRAVAFSNSI